MYLESNLKFALENQIPSTKLNIKQETLNRTLKNINLISDYINLTDAKKDYCQNALFYNGIKLYNSIPNDK